MPAEYPPFSLSLLKPISGEAGRAPSIAVYIVCPLRWRDKVLGTSVGGADVSGRTIPAGDGQSCRPKSRLFFSLQEIADLSDKFSAIVITVKRTREPDRISEKEALIQGLPSGKCA